MTADEFKAKYGARTRAVRKPQRHEEDDIQQECVRWFRDYYPDIAPLLFHPNNEAYFGGYCRTDEERRIKGRRAKEKGVLPGVADLILLYPSKPYHGLCIELKTKKGKQSESQKQWQHVVSQHGYRYDVVRNIKEFRTIIEEYTGRTEADSQERLLERLFGKQIQIHKQK